VQSLSNHLHFITATLLLSVASPLFAFTCDFKPLIAQAQTAQDRQAEADRLLEEANSQFSEGQFGNSEGQLRKALESFQQILSRQQILSIYKELGYRRQERDLTFMIGVIYGQLGQYDQSLKYSQQTLAIDRELGNRCQEQDTLFKISSMYGVLGQYDQVLEGLDKILAINRELDKPCDTFLSHDNDISDIYQMLGQPDQALKTLEQSLAFERKVGDRKQEELTLFVISRLYQHQRQYDQALAALQKASSINRELGARSSEQSTLTSGHYILISENSILIRIGEIYEQQGQYEQALQSYQQALTLSREASNPFGAINSLMKLSRVYQRLGQYEQALQSYQQALAADRSASPRYDKGQQYVMSLSRQYLYMSLSQVYRELDRDERSQESYQQALAIGKKHGNLDPSIRALNDWGAVQAKSGHFPEALETFEQALAMHREVDKSNFEENEAIIFRNRGFVYRKLGQLEKARESYKQALKLYQQELARTRKDSCSREDELRLVREIAQIYEIIGERYLAQEFERQSKKAEFVADIQLGICTSLCAVPLGIVLTEEGSSSSLVSCK